MAVLGKIRSKGALLVSIIGLGLFAFIAEEAFRSCESTKNNERQQIAEVLGEKLTYQEYQDLIDEYTEVIKMTQGQETLNEDQLNQVRDMVWNQYIQTTLIANEAKKVGLKVTDDEVRDILNQGTNPMLMQTPFVNQQTGRFDANILKQFMSEYKKAQTSNPQQAEQMRTIYRYWTFMEKNLRQQLLAQKYQTLLAATFFSNKVEAKQAFNEDNSEANIDLGVFSYATINDKDIEVTESDLKAKYDELKPRFKQAEETRDIKYVSVKVTASAKDRAAAVKEVNDFAAQLQTSTEPAEIIRKSGSAVAYLGVPVLKTAFPMDIQNQIDSVAVGATTAVKENVQDNTLNVIKLISKQELPDSVQFAIISDGKEGEPQWMTTVQYQNAPSMDVNTQQYINALNTTPAGETKTLILTGDTLTFKVLDRKAMKTKYLAAVIKKTIDFSKETYSAAYNKFSQYVSGNQTIEDLEKAAKKNGYQVLEAPSMRSGQHLIAGIHGSHDALKWVFEADDENTVSPLYECGDNDNLLVVGLTKINKKGYIDINNTMLKEYLKTEVIKDKKAAKLMEKAKGVKNIADAKKQGAQVVSVQQVTFSSPAFVAATGAAEPALSGAVAGTQNGKFSKNPVKGNGGVYVFNVKSKVSRAMQYNEKEYLQRQAQRQMQMAGNYMQELYLKADIKDNRYMFF
jgi:peptidyl-prolyl cis-trans isomerase D